MVEPTEISKCRSMVRSVLIVEGKFCNVRGGRFKLLHTELAIDKGSNFVKIVISEDVDVTKIGCRVSMFVAYCIVESFNERLSIVLLIFCTFNG